MKISLSIILMLFLQTFTCCVQSGPPANLTSILKDAKNAERKKLPKTSLEHLKKLQNEAKSVGEKGMYILAVAKIALNRAYIQGKEPREKISILRGILKKSDKDVQPILKSILAIWFWHYYKANSYTFSARSQTVGLDNDDFTTWDLPKLLKEISRLFNESLKNKDILLSTSISEYKGLIKTGDLPKEYCKTLYDFLLFEAIKFYKNGMAVIPAREDAFEIDTNENGFSSYSDFIKFNPKTTDLDSHKLKALKLYQELMRLYIERKTYGPLIDLDIKRHKFVRENGVGGGRSDLYVARLNEIIKEFKNVKESTLASYELAQIEFERNDYKAAKNRCDRAIGKFKDSDGADKCVGLVSQIIQKDFSVVIDSNVNNSNSYFFLSHKNLKKIYVKIVKDDWEYYAIKKGSRVDDYLGQDRIEELVDQSAVKSWSIDLNESKDFKYIKEKVVIPKLKHGFYRIFVSANSDFTREIKNKVTYSSFWVTDTTVLLRNLGSDLHGMVIESKTGRPLKGASVKLYKYDRKERKYKYHK